MPDSTRQEGVMNHYFAYPITYNGKRCYVFCRALHDNNTNRLYVHEVFVEENIKMGNTLQTAASQPHGGIALYRDILANVLDAKDEEKNSPAATRATPYNNKGDRAVIPGVSSEGKGSDNISNDQEKTEKVAKNQSPIQGLDGYTEDEVLSLVRGDIDEKLADAGMTVVLLAIALKKFNVRLE